LAELLPTLRLAEHAPDDRPYTIANFVASVDGRATFQGRSGQLGDDGDRAMFHGLREQAEAVMAGTRTLATERYGRILGKRERRERRVQHGLTPEPIACVVTRSGTVPLEAPLFSELEAKVVLFSPVHVDVGGCRAQVEVVRVDPGEMTLMTVMRHLRAEHGIRFLLCEGGPTLFGALLQEGLIDELFLTVAPKLVGGGSGPTISSGPELSELQPLQLRWLLERQGSLYVRYALKA
jgi:5-amino-6-(5-phosphoribosylamino)uracil reductase